jgi:hypothetical protein
VDRTLVEKNVKVVDFEALVAENKLPLFVKISFKKRLEERKFSAGEEGDKLRLTNETSLDRRR